MDCAAYYFRFCPMESGFLAMLVLTVFIATYVYVTSRYDPVPQRVVRSTFGKAFTVCGLIIAFWWFFGLRNMDPLRQVLPECTAARPAEYAAACGG